MKMKNILVAITSIALSAGPAFAGWKSVDEDGAITLMSDGKIKQSSPEEGIVTIVDSEKGTVTLINDSQSTYVSAKPEEFCNSMKAMMEAAMAQLPPEHRAMMEKMENDAAAAGKPSVAIKKMGSGGKIAGWDTEKYQVTVNGELYQELWLVSDSELMKDFKKVDFSVFRKFSSCTESEPGAGQDPELSPEYEALTDKGVEVKSVTYNDIEPYASNTVSLEKTDISESEFQVPAGYRKVGLMDVFPTTMDGGGY